MGTRATMINTAGPATTIALPMDDLHLPFSLQHGYDRSDGAVPVFRQDDTVHQFTEFFER